MFRSKSAQYIFYTIIIVDVAISIDFSNREQPPFTIPAEFEEQEYIWLSWMEEDFLGSDPFYVTMACPLRSKKEMRKPNKYCKRHFPERK